MPRVPPQNVFQLAPRLKVWLEIDGRYAFGFGLSEMLQAVELAGSIKGAAAALGKSYRYVWGRVKEAEAAIGRQLVETHVGGKDSQRSALTPAARQLLGDFLAMRARMLQILQAEFGKRFR
jgi:molybdate transport system regulatory protein